MINKQRCVFWVLLLLMSSCSTAPQRWARDVDEVKIVLLGPLYEEKERYNFKYPLLLQSVLNEVTSRQKELLNDSAEDRNFRWRWSNWCLENQEILELKTQVKALAANGGDRDNSNKEQIRVLKQKINDIVSQKTQSQPPLSSFPELKVVYESNEGFTNKVNRAWHQIIKIKEGNRGVFDNIAIANYLQELELHDNLFSLAVRIVPPPPGDLNHIRLQGYRFINVDDKLVDANGFDFTFRTTPERLREDLTRIIVRLIISSDFSTPSLGTMGFVRLKQGCLEEGEERAETECVEDIYIGRYPVTVQQWASVLGRKEDAFLKKQNPLNPVVNVSLEEVQIFIKRLNSESKLNYRLPTEAEWEYACKSNGTSLVYGTGTNRISHRSSNFLGTGEKDTWLGLSPVGSFYPNLIGLYDMSGNSWEWTDDEADFEGRGTKHVIKGGSFDSVPSALSCRHSDSALIHRPALDIGFRLVID